MNVTRTIQVPYRLRLWGTVALTAADGAQLTPTARRVRAMLAWLALAPGHTIDRAALAALLWSERSDDQARANLRQALHDQMALSGAGNPLLVVERDRVRFAREQCAIDHDELFDLAATHPEAFAKALDATDPRFLDGLDGVGESFDNWLVTVRARQSERLATTARSLAAAALAGGDAVCAQGIANAWARFDGCDEAMARIGFAADGALGDAVSATRRMARLRATLAAEVDAPPAASTTAEHDAVLHVSAAAAAPSLSMPAVASVSDATLPAATLLPDATPLPVAVRVRRRLAWLAGFAVATLTIGGAAWHGRAANGDANARAEAAVLTTGAVKLIATRTPASYAAAEVQLRRAVSIDPGYAPALAELALAVRMPAYRVSINDPARFAQLKAESQRYVDRALAIDPGLPRALAIKGMIIGGPSGTKLLEQSVALDAQDADAWLWLGGSEVADGHYRRALDADGHAAALAPTDARHVTSYINVAIALGRRDLADAALAGLRAGAPNAIEPTKVEMWVAFNRGELAAATALAVRLIDARPNDAWRQLGPMVGIARAVGADDLGQRLAAADPAMQAQLAPLFDPAITTLRTIRNPGSIDIDATGAEQARQLLARRRGDVLLVAARNDGLWPHTNSAKPLDVPIGASLVVAMRQAGRAVEADALVAELAAIVAARNAEGTVDYDTAMQNAAIAALRGDRMTAIAAIDRAIEHGWRGQIADWARDPADEPEFAALVGDPRFTLVRARLRVLQANERPQVRANLMQFLARISPPPKRIAAL